MGFDLSNLTPKAEETEIDLLDIKGEETGVKVTVASLDSERVKNGQRKRLSKMNQADITSISKRVDATEKELLQTLADAIVSWDGLEQDGKSFDCTEENKLFLLQNSPHFKEQIHVAAANRSLFMSA